MDTCPNVSMYLFYSMYLVNSYENENKKIDYNQREVSAGNIV